MAKSLCTSHFNYEFNINTCRRFGLDKIDDNKTKVKIGGQLFVFVKQQGLCDLFSYVMFLKRTGEIENGVWHSASALKDYENVKNKH